MDLTKDIIPESLFQKVIIALILIFAAASAWGTFTSFQHIQSMLDKDLAPTSTEGMTAYSSQFSVHLSEFTFTKSANIDTSFTYVTLTDLTTSPSKEKSMEILSSSSSDDVILGISSHPSFIVSEDHRSFWINQIYLEIGFLAIGFFLIILGIIWILSFNFEEYKKLFTEKVYQWVLTLFFMIFAGFIIDALLYARKINFLNTEFSLGLSPAGGISSSMVFILTLLLFVLIFLRRGIPMQQEQDLTV